MLTYGFADHFFKSFFDDYFDDLSWWDRDFLIYKSLVFFLNNTIEYQIMIFIFYCWNQCLTLQKVLSL